MNHTQHTPGPWATVCNGASTKIIDHSGKAVCMVTPRKGSTNAPLIENAPAMLEALRDLTDSIQQNFELNEVGVEPDGSEWPVWLEARTLISRIDGDAV